MQVMLDSLLITSYFIQLDIVATFLFCCAYVSSSFQIVLDHKTEITPHISDSY